MTIITKSESETEKAGENFAGSLRPGIVIALYGGLGVGKTAFVRGLARGLGIRGRVNSPTFTIVNEYGGGGISLFHFDMYRLGDADELFGIGWEDYLVRGGVCAVEWSENVEEAFDGSELTVRIKRLSDSEREITIEGGGRYAHIGV